MKVSLNIICDRNAILKALFESRMNNLTVGIHSKELGPATYLTGVKEIFLVKDEEPVIILAGHDITGYFLQTTTLRLSDIINVILFNTVFKNMALKNYGKKESLTDN